MAPLRILDLQSTWNSVGTSNFKTPLEVHCASKILQAPQVNYQDGRRTANDRSPDALAVIGGHPDALMQTDCALDRNPFEPTKPAPIASRAGTLPLCQLWQINAVRSANERSGPASAARCKSALEPNASGLCALN